MIKENKIMPIKTIIQKNRPREKAINNGIKSLSDIELLAIVLGSGSKGYGVHQISLNLQKKLDTNIENISIKDLQEIDGIGIAKATIICAAIEISRRYLYPSKRKISHPKDIIPFIIHYSDREEELFLTIALNGANEIIKVKVISIGILNKTIVHPREVFKDLIKDKAASFIVAHNHPSGNVTPSRDDFSITERLKDVGEIMGIPLLDHIVFSNSSYYSFVENNKF